MGFSFERWNGKGYPTGAGGEDIPLPMRVVHLSHDYSFGQIIGGLVPPLLRVFFGEKTTYCVVDCTKNLEGCKARTARRPVHDGGYRTAINLVLPDSRGLALSKVSTQ